MATLVCKCLSLIEKESDHGTILIWMVILDRKCLSLIDEKSGYGRYIDLDGDSSM
jgi:hypothetical protein